MTKPLISGKRNKDDFMLLVDAAHAISIEGQKQKRAFEASGSVWPQNRALYTPEEQIIFSQLHNRLVDGSQKSFLNRVMRAKGMPAWEAENARCDIATIFFARLPMLSEYASKKAVRAFLRKIAQTVCRKFRESEPHFIDTRIGETADVSAGFAALSVRSIPRGRGKRQNGARGSNIRVHTSRYGEPIAPEPEYAGRVAVKTPTGCNPEFIYLMPDLAQHIEALPPRLKNAILLKTAGYSRREGARIMKRRPDKFKRLLEDAREQLRVVLDPPICSQRKLPIFAESAISIDGIGKHPHAGSGKPSATCEVVDTVG